MLSGRSLWRNDRLRFAVVALWHPEWHDWCFCQLWAMPFGLLGCVLDFDRMSAFIVALARRWFAIPLLGFHDDLKSSELQGPCPSADDTLRMLLDFLGLVLDQEKRQAPSSAVTIFGHPRNMHHGGRRDSLRCSAHSSQDHSCCCSNSRCPQHTWSFQRPVVFSSRETDSPCIVHAGRGS